MPSPKDLSLLWLLTGCRGCPDQNATTCEEHTDCDVAAGFSCNDGICEEGVSWSGGVTAEEMEENAGMITGLGAADEPTEIGAVIGEFCDINAYQNGPNTGHVERLGSYGYEWQCVELTYRFICQYYGLADCSSNLGYGNANQWFTNERGHPILAKLDPIPNGSADPPRPGDVLTWSGGTWGHVAVVKEADLESGIVYVLEQNCYQCSNMYGIEYRDGGYWMTGVQGWMRYWAGGEATCDTTEDTCAGDISNLVISGHTLQVTGSVTCTAGIARWSLVVDETRVHTETPGDASLSYTEEIDLSEYGVEDGTHTLGLWAESAETGEAELLASATFTQDTSDPCTSEASTGCYDGDVYWYDSCGNRESLRESCDGDKLCEETSDTTAACVTCRIEAEPEEGEWTPDFTPNTDCSCDDESDCYTLYRGRVDDIDGNEIDMNFTKAAGDPSTVDISWWVVVGADTYPSCEDRESFVERDSGTWSAGDAELSVDNIPAWPTESEYEAASAGEQKKLFIITGGSDGPDDKRWYQKQAIVLTKVCD